MKQLLILSGKGGTGKTTVAGAFIYLENAKAYADCDVDAPNLHLISHWAGSPECADYFGMPKARIDTAKCTGCGECLKHCRFDAVKAEPAFRIKPFACEGCGVCAAVCPVGAVSMAPAIAGELALYREEGRVFSTATLRMGSGTSGKLVTEVKRRMGAAAKDAELAIIDGSPGIGCPVIASISGVDMVLIVAEPSCSGISDMQRIVKTAERFETAAAVCVNKADVDSQKTEVIRAYCSARALPFVGTIPFDTEAVHAVNSGKSIAERNTPSGRAVKEVYQRVKKLLLKKGSPHDTKGLVKEHGVK